MTPAATPGTSGTCAPLHLRRDRVRLPIWIVGITAARAVHRGERRRACTPTQADLDGRGGRCPTTPPSSPSGPDPTARHDRRADRVQHRRLRLRRRGPDGHVPRRPPHPGRRGGRPDRADAGHRGRAPRPSPPRSSSPPARVLGGAHHPGMLSQACRWRGSVALRRRDGRRRAVLRRRHRGDRAGHRAQPRRLRHGRRRARRLVRRAGDRRRRRAARCRGCRRWGGRRPSGRTPASGGGRCCCWPSARSALRGGRLPPARPPRTSAPGWSRRGPAAEASPWLGRPVGLALRLQRASLIGWASAWPSTGVAYGSVAQDVADLIGDNERLEDLIAQGGGSLTDSFFATSLLMLALITGGFAVAADAAAAQRGDGGPGRATCWPPPCPDRRWAMRAPGRGAGGRCSSSPPPGWAWA